jgi:hypothetical protein
MKSVKEILLTMPEQHIVAVREQLSIDKSFNKFTLDIFDAFYKDVSENTIQSELNLSNVSFKVFERVIERGIIDFYGIENKSIKDMLFSSIFYSLYGSKNKNNIEKTKELEELFHSMKQFNVEQEAYPILLKLYELNIDTRLEAVYKHLSEKYLSVSEKNEIISNQFSSFNKILAIYINNHSEDSKDLIVAYKKIRSTYQKHPNNTTRTYYNLSKLTCVVFTGKTEILNDGDLQLGLLLDAVKSDIENLPLSIDRFYLSNIFSHVYTKHLINVDKPELSIHVLKKKTIISLFEANNFFFPNHITNNIYEKYLENESCDKNYLVTANNTNNDKDFLKGGFFSTILN